MSRIESSGSSATRHLDPEVASSSAVVSTGKAAPTASVGGASTNSIETYRPSGAVSGETAAGVCRPERQPGEGNGFEFGLGGVFPPQVAGNLAEQLRQGGLTAAQAEAAAASLLLGDSAAMDAYARKHLEFLSPNPPIEGAPTSLTDYQSTIPGASPKAVFEHFVKNPAAVFGAAGLEIKPAITELKDGAQVFLQDKGPPPVWAPITIRLDPENHAIHITTMDGHPLRGTNRFLFQDDGHGGTTLRQYSAFQGSSPATTIGLKLMDPIERQHDIWRSVHAHLHDTLASH